jgi:hypothetical protein
MSVVAQFNGEGGKACTLKAISLGFWHGLHNAGGESTLASNQDDTLHCTFH